MQRLGWIGVLIVYASACGGQPSAPEDSHLAVAVDQVVRDQETAGVIVTFSVTNRGSSGVYLARCGSMVSAAMDRFADGWEDYSSGTCPGPVDMSHHLLEVGEQLTSSFGLAAADPGTYRLRVGTSSAPGSSTRWTVTSDSFVVE